MIIFLYLFSFTQRFQYHSFISILLYSNFSHIANIQITHTIHRKKKVKKIIKLIGNNNNNNTKKSLTLCSGWHEQRRFCGKTLILFSTLFLLNIHISKLSSEIWKIIHSPLIVQHFYIFHGINYVTLTVHFKTRSKLKLSQQTESLRKFISRLRMKIKEKQNKFLENSTTIATTDPPQPNDENDLESSG